MEKAMSEARPVVLITGASGGVGKGGGGETAPDEDEAESSAFFDQDLE